MKLRIYFMKRDVNKMSELQKSIEPVLQYAILCDAITKDQSGKPVYIGAFHNLVKPGVLPQFIIAFRWICGIGEHIFRFNILDPDLKNLHKTSDFSLQFKTKIDSVQREFTFINFNFKISGVYWIEVILNHNSYLSIPLPVHESIS